MAANHETIKPAVHIFCSSDVRVSSLNQVQYGMEEEGIPFVTETKPGLDALHLAWEAAQTSRLSVGLGLDGNEMVLHFSKLDQTQPLFRIPARSTESALRALGANGARLVKKMPLKPVE